MNNNEFKTKLLQQYPNLSEADFTKFESYKQFLQEKNKQFNLTRLDTEELVYEKYFYQAIVPFFRWDLNNMKLLDIGSGSGNPGIILKIIYPEMKLSIIESNNKRVTFMQELCNLLGFEDVNFYPIRAEELDKSLYDQFDIVTSRAVSNLGALIEISCQPCKVGGYIIEPKSNNYQPELDLVKLKMDDYGVELEKIEDYDASNSIIYLKKIKSPNNIYPRLWKDIVKDYKG